MPAEEVTSTETEALQLLNIFFSPLCSLEISHGKPGKVRIVTDDGRNRGGVDPTPFTAPMVEGVNNKGIKGGLTSKSFRKGQSVIRKKKFCIRVLEIVGDTLASPKDGNTDADKGDGG